MAVIDIILIVLVALALIKGLKDGFIRQAGGIAGLLLGIFIAGRFSSMFAGWLHQWIDTSENIVKTISFALIVIGVCICMHFVGMFLEKIVRITLLGWLNRLLGALLSVFGIILIAGVTISLIQYVNESWFILVPQDVLDKSKGLHIITSFTDVVFPYLKSFFS